jgi:DNA-directed RNA polymerase subunit F
MDFTNLSEEDIIRDMLRSCGLDDDEIETDWYNIAMGLKFLPESFNAINYLWSFHCWQEMQMHEYDIMMSDTHGLDCYYKNNKQVLYLIAQIMPLTEKEIKANEEAREKCRQIKGDEVNDVFGIVTQEVKE